MKKAKKILCLLATVLISNVLVPIHKVSAAPDVTRISGINRYDTSLKILDKGWSIADNLVIKKSPTNKKVTLGMTVDEVLEIMGEPLYKDEPTRDTYRYYYINDNIKEIYRDKTVLIEFTKKHSLIQLLGGTVMEMKE